MSKHYLEILKHILDECVFIQSVITPDITKSELVENETLKRAVIRSLEIIGEATKNIPIDIKLHYSLEEFLKLIFC